MVEELAQADAAVAACVDAAAWALSEQDLIAALDAAHRLEQRLAAVKLAVMLAGGSSVQPGTPQFRVATEGGGGARPGPAWARSCSAIEAVRARGQDRAHARTPCSYGGVRGRGGQDLARCRSRSATGDEVLPRRDGGA
ncbi:hypothetical protein ABZ388_19070 [Micromonospora parva]|uniref:hypothetical protein n=1 Tax=Micromonospora parva TaxID=1464048 RepID=UPI0033E342FA